MFAPFGRRPIATSPLTPGTLVFGIVAYGLLPAAGPRRRQSRLAIALTNIPAGAAPATEDRHGSAK